MSALAVPVPAPSRRPRRRGGHLQLVGPGYVAPPARPLDAPRGTGEASGTGRRPSHPVSREAPIRLTARGRTVRHVLGLVVGTMLSIGAGSVLGVLVGPGAAGPGPVERVSVATGDTLWGIAAATAEPGQDVRDVVDDILRLNGLTSGGLAVGQQLLVPAG